MTANPSETIFVGDREMAKRMRTSCGNALRSRFVCPQNNTNCSHTIALGWNLSQTLHRQLIWLPLPAWFDRQFSGAA